MKYSGFITSEKTFNPFGLQFIHHYYNKANKNMLN